MNNMELETDIEALDMEMGDVTIHYCPVIPNPEGEPTAELKTADIEGTIYKIVDEEARTELENKVDKVEGKDLSTNDYTDEDKAIVDGVTEALNGKVDKDGDKVLSDNNYSDEDKAIVDGVTSALNDKADKSDTYTKSEVDSALDNKVDKVEGKGLSENDFTDTLKDKLDGIEEEANKTVVDNSVTATSTNPVESKAIYNLLNDLLPEAEETGNPITISNASGFNAKALTVDMLPIQAGSGTPSPDNPRPISGRNSLDITVNGNTETVNFDGTVYGGTSDVVNGGTSNEWAIVDLGNLNWDKIENNNYRNFTSKALNPISYYNANEKTVICEAYKSESYNSASQQGDIYIWIVNSNMIAIKDTSKSGLTANEFKNAVSGIKACYKLSTPTTLTTPATLISLNKGNNTLSTSGDNMDLKYSKIPQ